MRRERVYVKCPHCDYKALLPRTLAVHVARAHLEKGRLLKKQF